MASFIKIAHRGASGNFPENTALAFERAIEARADMIEMDCQLSADGHVVIFHDQRLSRTAGVRGMVKDKSLDELKRLDVGKWRKNNFKGERILTLEESLELVGGRADLCLDIKHYPNQPSGIEIKLLFIVSRYEYLDRTIFSSFDCRCLSRLRELAPEARLGVIADARSKTDPLALARGLDAASVHIQAALASRDFLERAWEQGLDVYVWTINDLREMESFVSYGVQGIVSDYPEKFWKLKWKTA